MEHFADNDARDCESLDDKEPLLKDHTKNTTARSYNSCDEGLHSPRTMEEEENAVHGITDTMMYRTKSLTTWEAFQITYTTVWVSSELWAMMLRLTGVAFLIAFITILVVPNPSALKVAKFTSVSKFLNVVVGLLLGFFMKSSMERWHHCVNGFLELLDAIRNLQMQFVALGVPEKEACVCLRWGFASAWLLYGQLLLEARVDDAKEARDNMWEKLNKKIAYLDKSKAQVLLESQEIEVLRTTRDPPGMMWMWVAAYIGRMAQDGWIPPMASPTYGRIMNLCQSAHAGIRQVRAAISVQAPLTYTHMLATLVHINNFLNALTFGVVSGVAIGTALIAHEMHFYGAKIHTGVDASMRQSTQDWQNMVVTFLYCFFGPLLYQALLLISMHLAQPFDSEDARIPMDRLLHQLEVDLCNGRDLVDHMDFEKPCFKQPPAK